MELAVATPGGLGATTVTLNTPAYLTGYGRSGITIHYIELSIASTGAIGSGCYVEFTYTPVGGATQPIDRVRCLASSSFKARLRFRDGLKLPALPAATARYTIGAQVKASNGTNVVVGLGIMGMAVVWESS